MNHELAETCMFFVDDSNIWIEAQKFAASGNRNMPKLKDRDRDPRLRIDIGKLVNTLRNGRSQGPSFLYGSRPPPNDSVWEAFEKSNFQTKIYDRAYKKEKEVDNSMATDLSAQATELRIRAEYDAWVKQQIAKTTFVVITGDRDMLPPVKRVLESNIQVDLWAWESGISDEYLKLSYHSDLLSVKYLNWIFEDISFTNYRSTRKNKAKQVDPRKTIVLCEFANPGEDDLESAACEQLLPLGRLFYFSQSETETEIYVEFPDVAEIEGILLKTRELFKGIFTVLSWPEYASRFNKSLPAMIETSNVYGPLTDDNDKVCTQVIAEDKHEHIKRKAKLPSTVELDGGQRESEEMQELNGANNNDGWQTVGRSDIGKGHRRAVRNAQKCSDRVHCKKRGECGYQHTDQELNLFRANPEQDFGRWKTRKCNVDSCRRGKHCPFAHTQHEAWCLRCCIEGHYTEECRYTR